MSQLDDAISSAVASAPPLPSEEVQEEQQQQSEQQVEEKEQQVEETLEEESLDDLGLSAAEVKAGRELIAALKDPQKAQVVAEHFAKQAGYTKGEVTTKQEVKSAKKDIVAGLKEKLGPELEYLADKIGPAIQDYLNDQLEENIKPLKENNQARETPSLNLV